MAKTLTIAGSNFLTYYKTSTARIRETLRKTNVMNMEIVTKSISNAPQEGSEIVFKDGSRFLFGGFISRVQPLETGKGQLFNFEVEASDYAYIFNSKIARRAYTNQTLAYIVTDLMGEYVDASYGFDLTNVQTGPIVESISFNHISIRACFEKLAKTTGFVWWVDYEKKLYFQTNTTSTAPETVTDSSGNISSVDIAYDTSQVRNSVIVIGNSEGVESLVTITQTFTGDGDTRTWQFETTPSTISGITLNGVAKSISPIESAGATDYFIYSASQLYLQVSAANPTPAIADSIVITYYNKLAIITQLRDVDSIAFFEALDGGDGIYEYTIKDTTILTLDEAAARAQQELEQFSMPLVEGKIVTRSGLLASPTNVFKPGQVLTVNLPTQGLATDTAFLIQEVGIEVLDGSSSEYIYTIKFGGKIVGIQEFLEMLAAQQSDGTSIDDNPEEILTIEGVSDALEMSDTDTPASMSKDTPPYHYTSTTPVGKWNLSEWA